jgi:adenylate cyclase, class 2
MAQNRTHREIEVKLRIRDLSGLVAKLRQVGASCQGRVFERNSLYDTPENDFRRRGCLLRLRTKTPAPAGHIRGGNRQAVITSKAPVPVSVSRYKEKLERELALPPGRPWHTRLLSVGFHQGFLYERYRTTFRLPNLHLEIDQTPIGTFLELEGTPQAIDRTARALGFSSRDYLRSTYWDLFQAERRRGGRRLAKNMRFGGKKISSACTLALTNP